MLSFPSCWAETGRGLVKTPHLLVLLGPIERAEDREVRDGPCLGRDPFTCKTKKVLYWPRTLREGSCIASYLHCNLVTSHAYYNYMHTRVSSTASFRTGLLRAMKAILGIQGNECLMLISYPLVMIWPCYYLPEPATTQVPPTGAPPTSLVLVSMSQSCSSSLFALGTCSTTATILGMPAVMFCTFEREKTIFRLLTSSGARTHRVGVGTEANK